MGGALLLCSKLPGNLSSERIDYCAGVDLDQIMDPFGKAVHLLRCVSRCSPGLIGRQPLGPCRILSRLNQETGETNDRSIRNPCSIRDGRAHRRVELAPEESNSITSRFRDVFAEGWYQVFPVSLAPARVVAAVFAHEADEVAQMREYIG